MVSVFDEVDEKPAIEWNEGQARAIEQIRYWHAFGDQQVLRIGGLAGSGKTLLASKIPELIERPVTFCAPTGKAASVITRKTGVGARTVASVLKYGPSGGKHDDDCPKTIACVCAASGTFGKMAETDGDGTGKIVLVDEASMVNRQQWSELLGLGARIIAVGDFGQLPPVGDSKFSVVAEELLDIKLTDIVRQQEHSSIIHLARELREGGAWPVGMSTEEVTIVERPLSTVKVGYREDRPIIVATNRQRVRRNKEARKRRGFPAGQVVVGDIVMNLRNNPRYGVMNGERGTVTGVGPGTDDALVFLTVEMESGIVCAGNALKAQFDAEKTLMNPYADLWDYGYAGTCHKFQGSSAPAVMLLAENIGWMNSDEQRRWKYTAVTRAEAELTVVVAG